MKKVVISLLTLVIFFPYYVGAQANVECPNVSQLENTTVIYKDELLKALETIIPRTFGESDYLNHYADWEVVTAQPLDENVAKEYQMSSNYCGKEIADKSWLVELHFPRWEGKSDIASDGQIFVSKSKDKGWFVWYKNQ
ncbi:hypothetical protein V7112_05745 [Bacillus sp. JJ1566]|uniref:hypothetical protein n=1 Tax=Bacillus sp. JJ1566 TaxID=3122961 RepID=UPI0030002284